MRIWSLHPKYLDAKGLVALWRETLLAKKVLEGKTDAYRNHPQMNRFKESKNSLLLINLYLKEVFEEAVRREYHFDKSKFLNSRRKLSLNVTKGQLTYEFEHLLAKLKKRDPERYREIKNTKVVTPHPIFKVVKGDVEEWEVIHL